MFSGTIGSIQKHGSTIFAHKVNYSRNKCTIRRVHKACPRTIRRSYITVSYLPLTAITGITPLEYQITNRATTYAGLKGTPIEETNNVRIQKNLSTKKGNTKIPIQQNKRFMAAGVRQHSKGTMDAKVNTQCTRKTNNNELLAHTHVHWARAIWVVHEKRRKKKN